LQENCEFDSWFAPRNSQREFSDVVDKVLLLEMGADDYVTIPFSPRELIDRLRALIRRASRFSPEGVYAFDGVMVDFLKAEITRGGEKITVTTKEFKTLGLLTKNAKRVISRDELLEKIGGDQDYPANGRWTTTC
jgi:DNA-binding response OmpR family regulator